jgi:hypothetical protein
MKVLRIMRMSQDGKARIQSDYNMSAEIVALYRHFACDQKEATRAIHSLRPFSSGTAPFAVHDGGLNVVTVDPHA